MSEESGIGGSHDLTEAELNASRVAAVKLNLAQEALDDRDLGRAFDAIQEARDVLDEVVEDV